MNFEFEREIGFINSQPSLAECLTSFPAVLETFQTSSIKESTLIPPPPPFEQTFPSLQHGASTLQRPRSQKRAEDGPALPPPPPPLPAAPPAPEFPWMKEKKSAKKPSQSATSTSPAASVVPASGVGSPADGLGLRGAGGPEPGPLPEDVFPERQDSPFLPDLNFFAADSCLQLSGGLSPSLQGSLDSPVPFSEEELDFFTSTLCAIDLQFP
ncbi:PREDICTED: homeobox protein Hox-B2 [Colobus angolensis palliatus]|uniref:Homeobox domain-containing protein n=1 Tax=Colobus angolensis palliatus TaxID=336983 RepID=A0A2K5INS9_COLAP|nr:PREDICTED: homeobox protein Hox-B2 [Colobus angolensis palliatus]